MIIVDVEASGLHQHSYPIEIAWQDSKKPENFDSFLIVPLAHWCHWDDYAENEIHHISRELLFNSGITVNEACERLNSALINEVIYSDAIEYDQRWVMRLFDEAEIKPTFNFGSVMDLLPKGGDLKYSQLLESAPVKHRALDDARQIAAWVHHILET